LNGKEKEHALDTPPHSTVTITKMTK
jgi:hypothetical protein